LDRYCHTGSCESQPPTKAPVVAPPPANSWTIGQSTFTPGSFGDDNKATITASYELNLPVGPMSGSYKTSIFEASADEFLCTSTPLASGSVSTHDGAPATSTMDDTITIDFGLIDSTDGPYTEVGTTGTLKFCHVLTLTTDSGLVMDIRTTQLTLTIDLTVDFTDSEVTQLSREAVKKAQDTDFDLPKTLTVLVDDELIVSGRGTKLTIRSEIASVKVKMIQALFIDNAPGDGPDLSMISDGKDVGNVPISGVSCDDVKGTCALTIYFPFQYFTAESARVLTLRGTAGLSLKPARLLIESAAAGQEEAEANAEFVISLATMPIKDDVNGPNTTGIVVGSVCAVAAFAVLAVVAAMIRRKKMVEKQVAMAQKAEYKGDITVTIGSTFHNSDIV
jgi:hypothetical protein